jgi:hypothetical protein
MKTFSDSLSVYQRQLQTSELASVYQKLIKFVMRVKAQFEKEHGDKYHCGNVAPGYMDFSYFPFYDDYLKSEKLRFGIVLNHKELRFELWLMGQNAEIQQRYWQKLKTAPWNEDRSTMPQYSVLASTLIENPDFDQLPQLSRQIALKAANEAKHIVDYLKRLN